MSKSDRTAPIGTKYRLADGRIVFVRQSFIGTWKAFYRVLGKTKAGKDRTKETSLRAKCLPWRDTFEEAQADLDAAVKSQDDVFKDAKAVVEKAGE